VVFRAPVAVITGATAICDVMFDGTAASTALTDEIPDRRAWVVSCAEFCGFTASARNPCPA
jgi:hypothetical protein